MARALKYSWTAAVYITAPSADTKGQNVISTITLNAMPRLNTEVHFLIFLLLLFILLLLLYICMYVMYAVYSPRSAEELSGSRKRRREEKKLQVRVIYCNVWCCLRAIVKDYSLTTLPPLIHFRIKISAQKGLELLQQHPALKDQVMYRLLIQVNPCRPAHIQSVCEIWLILLGFYFQIKLYTYLHQYTSYSLLHGWSIAHTRAYFYYSIVLAYSTLQTTICFISRQNWRPGTGTWEPSI